MKISSPKVSAIFRISDRISPLMEIDYKIHEKSVSFLTGAVCSSKLGTGHKPYLIKHQLKRNPHLPNLHLHSSPLSSQMFKGNYRPRNVHLICNCDILSTPHGQPKPRKLHTKQGPKQKKRGQQTRQAPEGKNNNPT